MSPYRTRDEMAQAFLPPRPYASSFQFADFIHLLEARRVLILRIALATILFALGVALFLPTTYASSSVVMLDPTQEQHHRSFRRAHAATQRPGRGAEPDSNHHPRANWPPMSRTGSSSRTTRNSIPISPAPACWSRWAIW